MDRWLLAAVVTLILIGVGLSFASSPAAVTRFPSCTTRSIFAMRQSVFAAIGLVHPPGSLDADVPGGRRTAVIVYAVAIAIMIALPFMGHTAKGATRWLAIGRSGPCSRRSS
jgi:cell division protein FtsW